MKSKIALLGLSLIITGCAGQAVRVPGPRIASKVAPSTVVSGVEQYADGKSEKDSGPGVASSEQTRPTMARMEVPPRVTPENPRNLLVGKFSANNALTVSSEAMPLRQFLTYVFSELLKINFVLPADGAALDQPVTLNLQKPVSSRELFRLVEELLVARGLAINEKEKVFFVVPVSGKSETGIPIGFGSKHADVPDLAGTILQIVPLRYGANNTIERTINELIPVRVFADFQQGALFITGSRTAILRALDIVKLFDQPSIRSSRVGVLNLTYLGSKELVDQLGVLLENEGISVGTGRADGKSIALVPIDQLGAVVVFAATTTLLDRVEFWVKQIDRPSQGPSLRYFIYQPKYARASDLGFSLAPLLGGAMPPPVGNLSRDTRSALGSDATAITQDNALRRDASMGGSAQTTAAVTVRAEGLTLSVDPRSNSLVFYTSGPKYEALLPMIRRLDVPPKQILLEATIAEVTLSGEFARGVEFAFNKRQGGTPSAQWNLAGTSSSGLALNYIANATDSIRLSLTGNDSKVNVLSSPILVVRDGTPAMITVGNDVPTVGATATDPLLSSRTVTTVLYRKTGLSLAITPQINAQGSVVMRIDQSISSAVPGSSGVNGAPVFFDRKVSTEVVAGSGQSVLLAGLISENGSVSSSNIPGLSKIPGLGWLFSQDSKKKEKTELVLLITPKILESLDQWESVERSLANGLRYLDLSETVKSSKDLSVPNTPAAPTNVQPQRAP